MKHIHNKLLEITKSEPLFEKIIWVTVSQDFNISRLQQDIADAMNIEDLPKSEQKRTAVLRNKLRQIRHVLILDDVWEGFVLEKVGIPEPISSNRSKLVLTSRLKEFCKSIGCHEIVEVPLLSDEESMNLFLVHTGRGVLDVPPLKEILGDIVRECDRLPLAIKVIASSMKGINDVVEWRNALRELRSHITSVKGTDKEIYGRLKFSFDRLKDSNIQNCFLYCSLYPEDYRIPRVVLIEYWIDEGFLEMGSRQQLHDRGHTILNRLINNCLLEKAGDDVKMHDVMRDMALYIKQPHFIVKAGTGLEELPSKPEWKKDVERASFMMNKVSEIPLSLSPNCGNLSTLLLKKNRSLKRISESFFQHMYSLNILDLSYTGIKQLPNSVSNLETLNALVLRGCCNLRYMPSLEKLKALRKLDLRGTGIEKVPKGLEMLTNLTYLNLCTESLKELPITILHRLSCLQCLVLYVKSACVKMNRSELARLRKLEVFEGRFNELIDFNTYTKSIQGQQLTSYLLVMAPLGEGIDYVFRFEVNFRCNCDGCMLKLKCPGVKTVPLIGEKKTIVEATPEVSGCLCHSKASKAVGLTIKSWRNKSTQLITVPSFFCGGSIFDVVLRRMHHSLVVLSVINELQFGFNVIGLLML
ncbi:hypothetical protein E1A91_A01G044600v1 [Gossypium mustelinum]|uniref:Uncharacterized protein n=1 Tax=Gossypium mustelinum TaxID=34275 RepID=A0A5D3ADI9_GOSMU|nr:hypothetical protein E1A91_A01G044600v1 [Gossypium mustelinum]